MTAEPSPAAIKAARDRARSKHLHPLVVQLTDARKRHARLSPIWKSPSALGFDLSLVERIGS